VGRKSERKRDRWLEKELQRLLRIHHIGPLLWYIHFGEAFPEESVCQDCHDLQTGLCDEGELPETCQSMGICLSVVVPLLVIASSGIEAGLSSRGGSKGGRSSDFRTTRLGLVGSY
jgi:hypothetical protein